MTNSEDVFREQLVADLRARTSGDWEPESGDIVEAAVRLHTKDTQALREKLAALEVPNPCPECGGRGTKVYADTSTWRKRGGGQMLTTGPCDVCWGSRTMDWKGTDQRKVNARLAALEAENNRRACEVVELRLSRANITEDFDRLTSELSSSRAEVERLKAEVALRTSQMPMFVTMLRDRCERAEKALADALPQLESHLRSFDSPFVHVPEGAGGYIDCKRRDLRLVIDVRMHTKTGCVFFLDGQGHEYLLMGWK